MFKTVDLGELERMIGKTIRFYFATSSGIAVGDKIEITTFRASVVRRGWAGEQFGASYKKLK